MIPLVRRLLRLEDGVAHLRPWTKDIPPEQDELEQAHEQAQEARTRATRQVEEARQEMHWLEIALMSPSKRPPHYPDNDWEAIK